MSTTIKFTEIELHAEEKKLILKLAHFYVTDEVTLVISKMPVKNGSAFTRVPLTASLASCRITTTAAGAPINQSSWMN